MTTAALPAIRPAARSRMASGTCSRSTVRSMTGTTAPLARCSARRSRIVWCSLLTKPLRRCPTTSDSTQRSELTLEEAAGPASTALAAGEHERPGRCQRPAQPPDAVASADVDDQVVVDGAVEVVLRRVVDHVVGADRAHHVDLGRAGHAGDDAAERLGQLHGVGADTTGRADDEHPLSGLEASDVGERLERGAAGDRGDAGLLERDVRRLVDQLVLVGGGVLRIGAVGDPEHLIAGAEACDLVADGDDPSGDIGPGNRVLGLGDPVAGETDQVRGAGDEMGDTPVDAGGVDLDQHLRRRDLWPVDGAQLQHLGRAVSVLDHCTHRLTLAHHNDGVRGDARRGR